MLLGAVISLRTRFYEFYIRKSWGVLSRVWSIGLSTYVFTALPSLRLVGVSRAKAPFCHGIAINAEPHPQPCDGTHIAGGTRRHV